MKVKDTLCTKGPLPTMCVSLCVYILCAFSAQTDTVVVLCFLSLDVGNPHASLENPVQFGLV